MTDLDNLTFTGVEHERASQEGRNFASNRRRTSAGGFPELAQVAGCVAYGPAHRCQRGQYRQRPKGIYLRRQGEGLSARILSCLPSGANTLH